MDKNIYLDYAASAPIFSGVSKEVLRALNIEGNPSSFNDSGRKARLLVEENRSIVARFIGARKDEVIFTSSGSESNNLAIYGTLSNTSNNVITTPIEHPSILKTLDSLGRDNITISKVRVDNRGIVNISDLKSKITKETSMVSVIYANNEIGTIQPIRMIGNIIKEYRLKYRTRNPLFHVDACQALGFLNCNVNNLNVDSLTLNSSKIGGPKGVGALYIRRGLNIKPIIFGGDQELGFRAGTENVPGIAGLGKAIELLNPKTETGRLSKLRDYLIKEIRKSIPEVLINGALGDDRLPNNVHISILGIDSEPLLLELDNMGIHVGSGSACTSRSVEPSHVLRAIETPKRYINGSIRISMGHRTKESEIKYFLKVLPHVVEKIKKRYNF